jgi:hypothetical protein
VAEAWGQYGNPEKGECLPLEAITRGVVKTADWGNYVHAIVNCSVRNSDSATVNCNYDLCSVNPTANPNPVYSHPTMWHYYVSQTFDISNVVFFLLNLLFDPDGWGIIFVWTFSECLPDYTELNPRRQYDKTQICTSVFTVCCSWVNAHFNWTNGCTWH